MEESKLKFKYAQQQSIKLEKNLREKVEYLQNESERLRADHYEEMLYLKKQSADDLERLRLEN